NATLLLGPQAKHKVDSLGIAAFYDDPKVDSLEYPVTGIEGLYIPISSTDEIGIISSQLVYYNIQAQVLGSGEWNNLAELDANKRYCNNVIFESDSYVDGADSAYMRFVSQYAERFKKKPGKNSLYGYDTAVMVLSTIHNGATSRESLVAGLRQTRNFRGLHAKINFTQKRVNSWLWILQYATDRIQLLDGFNVE
ncbi:MAG: ABC transporter substrate-binding protein, partial [Bacteroidota bacterium]